MSDFEIEFEWPVAAKYEFRPADPQRLAEFEKDFGKTEEIPEAELPFLLGQIVPGGEVRDVKHRVGDLEEAVQKLIEWDGNQASLSKIALSIARKLGSLSFDPPRYGESRFGVQPSPPSDELMEWHGVADSLHRMFEGRAYSWEGPFPGGRPRKVQWPHRAAQFQGKIGIFLVPRRDGKPEIVFRPDDIKEALTLCAARMITNGASLGTCLNCKSRFLRGAGSKRRGDARFCKPRCKWEYHNEARRKAKLKSA
jgi:hypothetical protein